MDKPLYAHWHEFIVSSDTIDDMDHVNNVVYLEWVESVARSHADELGFDFANLKRMGGAFVVRRHEITYYAPAHAGDLLRVGTRILDCHGPRTTRLTAIYRGCETIAEASTEWVFVDLQTRRPKRVPASFIAACASQFEGASQDAETA